MHNEFVGTRAPRAAAFVCFKAAEEGGEFLIADGRAMFRDLNPDLVERLYDRSIRYSVMELPFFGWIDGLPEPVQGPIQGVVKGLVSAAINAKVDFSVDLRWGEVFLLTSRWEGFGNVIVEALATGTPIVSSSCPGGPKYILNDDKFIRKVISRDPSDYAKAIMEISAMELRYDDSLRIQSFATPYLIQNVCQDYYDYVVS